MKTTKPTKQLKTKKNIIDFLLQSALVEKRVYKRKDRRKRRAVQNAPIRDKTYKTC